jgi:hypothetical protein
MLWLIANLPVLKGGHYPPGQGSGYVDTHLGKGSVSQKAPFEGPAGLAGEVEARLSKCGLDGIILKAIVLWEESPDSMANGLKLDYEDVLHRQERCLQYISGWRRRDKTYKEWCQHK